VESTALHVGIFGHDAEVRLDRGVDHNFGLSLDLGLLSVPCKAVTLHKSVVELDISETLVLGLRHEPNSAENGQVNCAGYLDFVVAPFLKAVPDAVVAGLGNHVGNGVTVSAEVAFDSLGAKALKVVVSYGRGFL